jgi:hypothetical protein
VEDQDDSESIVFIIPEQKYGVVVSYGAYVSLVKYYDESEEVIDSFDNNDFIVSNEIILKKVKEV